MCIVGRMVTFFTKTFGISLGFSKQLRMQSS